MRTNYHTHTSRCQHATGSDEEYIKSAIKGGFKELGFSDHTPWKYKSDYVSDIRMLPEELPGYVESIHTLKDKYSDQINIKIGLECEYFPAYLDWLRNIVEEYQIDYIIFGNHHYQSDETSPYFGRHTDTIEMLMKYEESSIKGMECGIYTYFAHPDLFMRSYPEFDEHCETISKRICKKAVQLNIPLEYNIGYEATNEKKGITTYPHSRFWKIAASEGCTAIIGVDAHENEYLETPLYYNRAVNRLKQLKIKVINTLPIKIIGK